MSDSEKNTFLEMSPGAIADFVTRVGRPKLGVFVPDGSRRLVMSLTETQADTDAFRRLCATLPAYYLLKSLKVLFDHGLPKLMVPILSRSVLGRGSDYRLHTVMEGLRLLFSSEEWLAFYDQYDIRVRVYGETELLAQSECSEALTWIESASQRTSSHNARRLFFAIGESPRLGAGIAEAGIALFRELGRSPTEQELIEAYYGEDLPTADFYIMSSKLSGMGALPRFLVDGDTEAYFLPCAGAMGLHADTYRVILYDLLFERTGLRNPGKHALSSEDRYALRSYYDEVIGKVIGLGRRIGNVWVPEVEGKDDCR